MIARLQSITHSKSSNPRTNKSSYLELLKELENNQIKGMTGMGRARNKIQYRIGFHILCMVSLTSLIFAATENDLMDMEENRNRAGM